MTGWTDITISNTLTSGKDRKLEGNSQGSMLTLGLDWFSVSLRT